MQILFKNIQIALSFSILNLLGSVAFAQSSVAADGFPNTPLVPVEASELELAKANRALKKTNPTWQSGPTPEFPESEKALGHHGKVMVEGVLGVDGKMRHLTIATSSRAPVLDGSALAAAAGTVFSPAKDANDKAIPVVIRFPINFYSYGSDDGYGAAIYSCKQFVADQDWVKAAFPERSIRDQEFYAMIVGLGVMANYGSTGSMQAAFAKSESNESFEARWRAAIETCRSGKVARFADAMQPEGAIIDRMAAQGKKNRKKR